MDNELAELLIERHRLAAYDLNRSLAIVDAEIERLTKADERPMPTTAQPTARSTTRKAAKE